MISNCQFLIADITAHSDETPGEVNNHEKIAIARKIFKKNKVFVFLSLRMPWIGMGSLAKCSIQTYNGQHKKSVALVMILIGLSIQPSDKLSIDASSL
jgi:hypothetical protein